MKKIISLLLVLVCLVSLVGCNKQVNSSVGLQKNYVYRESDDVVKPSLKLFENKKCQFTFSSFSSYIGVGTYTISEDVLAVNTDDGEGQYTFKIDGKSMTKLIFDAENSSENLHGGKFADGAVFECEADVSST